MANILYQKLERQYSIDNGNTWITMDAYKVGDILENPSDCGGESSGSTCATSTTYSYGDYILTPSSSIVEYNVIPTVMVSRNYTATTTNSDCTTTIETSNEIIKLDVSPTSTNPSGENPNTTDRTVTATTEYGTYTFIQQGNPNVDSGGTESSGSTSGDTESTDRISFAWSGTAETQTFKINGRTYTATTNPYSATLTELGISEFTNANQMFYQKTEITEITSIPCSNSVTNMGSMFYNCYSLTSLDLSSLATHNVTSMSQMFNRCSGLTSLDLNDWDTYECTSMNQMFTNCQKLTSLDLSSFNLYHVKSMTSMFSKCYRLTSLDLSGWDMSNVTDITSMFYECNSLTTIKVTNCQNYTISKLQEALSNAGYSSTVANGIITVNH